jgi:PAS domain S-box-containing protein
MSYQKEVDSLIQEVEKLLKKDALIENDFLKNKMTSQKSNYIEVNEGLTQLSTLTEKFAYAANEKKWEEIQHDGTLLKLSVADKLLVIQKEIDFVIDGVSNIHKNNLELLTSRILIIIIIVAFVIGLILVFTSLSIANPLNKMLKFIYKLEKGNFPEKINYKGKDEIRKMSDSLNNFVQNLKHKAEFSEQIGKGNLDVKFTTLGSQDVLGNALLSMKESLKNANEEEKRRKEEDYKRNWTANGLAKFSDILRHNTDNIDELSYIVISNLVKYCEANQGGIYLLNDHDNGDKTLDLIGLFAYDRKKFSEKQIMFGENLVGACAKEKKTIYLKEIPDNYVHITSGLGEAVPRSLLIVPLKLEDEIFGIIEIASFEEIQAHEIEFVEKVGEIIASTFANVKIAARTKELLEQSTQQAEMMHAQEEEMRQNMEELLATQEESFKKETELEGISSALEESVFKAEIEKDYRILNANEKFVSTLNKNSDELHGASFAVFEYPEEDNLEAVWEQVFAGEKVSRETTMRFEDKELILFETFTPITDMDFEVAKVLYIAIDSTELHHKKVEIEGLQEQLNQLKEDRTSLSLNLSTENETSNYRAVELQALKGAIDYSFGIIEFDLNGNIIDVNDLARQMYQCEKDQMIGRHHSDFVSPKEAESKEYHEFWETILNGEIIEGEFSHKINEENITFYEIYSPVKNENNSLYKIISIISNIKAI